MKDNALYLEADEDITSAIDKLRQAPPGPVQIVVPKRSTMLQSIINLKLLKKAAESSGKDLVLVTSDKVSSDLAARVGLAVAPAVGAKAALGEAKPAPVVSADDEVIEADDPEPPADPTPAKAAPAKSKRPLLRSRPVTEAPVATALADAGETIAGEGPETTGPAATVGAGADAAASKVKVPNFKRLQRRVLWLAFGLFLVGGYILGMFLFSRASVTLYANGSKVDVDATFSVDPARGTSDIAEAELAGKPVSYNKDITASFTPTGKKDIGTKATGTMTVANSTGIDQPLVAGTRFQAPDGKIFRSNSDITVPKAYLDSGGDKVNGTQTVAVTADQNGDSYNEAPAAYAIPALGNPKITATGSQMTGGTTKTVTVVTQADIDAAVQAALEKDREAAEKEIQGRAPEGYTGLAASLTAKATDITPSPAIDSEATSAEVKLTVAYTQLSVKKGEFEELVKALETKQIGEGNQVYDDGMASAQITASKAEASGRQTFQLAATAYAGVKIDQAALAKNLAGKRYGDALEQAKKQPGVTNAEVNLWPGWASTLPTRPDKITVTLKVAGVK